MVVLIDKLVVRDDDAVLSVLHVVARMRERDWFIINNCPGGPLVGRDGRTASLCFDIWAWAMGEDDMTWRMA